LAWNFRVLEVSQPPLAKVQEAVSRWAESSCATACLSSLGMIGLTR
jgi:hypothetical protein